MVCNVGWATAADVPADVDPLPVRRVSPSVWYVQGQAGMAAQDNRGFMSNAGFVVTREGVVVFDALATPALARSLIESIRRQTKLAIRLVIVSHYHADHIYGLQAFQDEGAAIWARREGQDYLASDVAKERLAQRRRDLSPWVDASTHLVPADRWISLTGDERIDFDLGGRHFQLISGGDSHAPGDLMLLVPDEGVLFAGDLFFTGRLPFVVDGNTREWLKALDRMQAVSPGVVIPGHGPASRDVAADLKVTRDYLGFLRERMGHAVADLQDFDQVYDATDWSDFASLPTFDVANRRNAYSVYLEMQSELLQPP